MVANAIPRTISVLEESSFADTSPDHDSNGQEIYVFDDDLSGVVQQAVDNQNYVQHVAENHNMLKALKSESSWPYSMYLHGSPATAGDGAQAASITLDKVLRSWAGGRKLGYGEGISGGTAAAPDIDDATNFTADADVGFFYDDSASTGYFRTITDISTLTLTLYGGALPFTPAGADVMHAVISIYPLEGPLTDHSDGDHTTLGYAVKGKAGEDYWELYGCKPTLEFNDWVQGDPTIVRVTNMVTDFGHEALSADTLSGAPDGEPGLVVGKGTDTLFYLMAKDGSFTSTAINSFQFDPGIQYEAHRGPNGTEGVHGYTIGSNVPMRPTITITLPLDDDYATAFRLDPDNPTEYACLCQVGTSLNKAIAIEAMRMEVAQEPTRTVVNGVASTQVVFRLLRYDGATSVTGDDLEWFRAPWRLYLVA